MNAKIRKGTGLEVLLNISGNNVRKGTGLSVLLNINENVVRERLEKKAQLHQATRLSQNAKQEMAWQVRGRPPPEYILSPGSRFADVEIMQTCNLDVERLLILWRRTDLYTRHGVQDD